MSTFCSSIKQQEIIKLKLHKNKIKRERSFFYMCGHLKSVLFKNDVTSFLFILKKQHNQYRRDSQAEFSEYSIAGWTLDICRRPL